MEGMDFFLNAVSLGCGLYGLYVWIRLLAEKRLFKNSLLIPKDKEIADCYDEEGYLAFIRPRLGVLAIAATLCGALLLVNDLVTPAPLAYPWTLVPLTVLMVVLVWYAVANSRANRTYFGL